MNHRHPTPARFLSRGTCCLLMSAFCQTTPPAAAQAAGPPDDPAAEARVVQLDRLRRHSFASDKADPKAPGLLLGNARIGGCLAASGLGIPVLWGADLWSNTDQRLWTIGPMLSCAAFQGLAVDSSRQELSLLDGVAKTTVRHSANSGYDAEVFCSMDDLSLLAMRLTCLGDHELEWQLELPWTESLEQRDPGHLAGASSDKAFTPFVWSLRSNRPLTRAVGSRFTLRLPPGQSLTLAFRLHAKGALANADPVAGEDFAELLARQRAAWDGLWRRCAVLALPDPEIERLWYRSLHWTLSTCGSGSFLPGESMFAVPCWDMHPFTYGAAGWATQAFTSVGLPERAKALLQAHLKPQALRDNAVFYTRALTGAKAGPDAMAFAHEVRTDGRNIPCAPYEMQRHLDGFAASLFYRHQRFYPGESLPAADLYSLLKGLAESWCGLARRDPASGEFLLPGMTSLTENLVAPHPIDAALAAKWCLLVAHRQAVALGRDAERRGHWLEVAEHLQLPRNAERYLEYSGDPDQRAGGGYQGVRGFVYLGYPSIELIPTLDRATVLRTLEHTWTRNLKGEGMIGFVANWFALADLHHGRGDHALEILKHNFRCEDAWQQGVSEFPGSANHHFTTNYASCLLVPLAMAVQSADNRIEVFAGLPTAWRDFAFYQVPAEAGIRVSGVKRAGKVESVRYHLDGRLLHESRRPETLRIESRDGTVKLVPENS